MNASGETPWERWSRDPKALALLSEAQLQEAFVLFLERTVSHDRTVSLGNVAYEVPRNLSPNGSSKAKIQIQYRILQGTYHVVTQDGQVIRIHPVDLVANARARRAGEPRPEAEETRAIPPASAADLAFAQDHGPVVDPEGNVWPIAGTEESVDPESISGMEEFQS